MGGVEDLVQTAALAETGTGSHEVLNNACNLGQPPPTEPRWQTYLKSLAFILPAVLAWRFACVFLVPRVRETCFTTGLEKSQGAWIWQYVFFLVQRGTSLCLVLVASLILLESLARGWALKVGCFGPFTASIHPWRLPVFQLLSPHAPCRNLLGRCKP